MKLFVLLSFLSIAYANAEVGGLHTEESVRGFQAGKDRPQASAKADSSKKYSYKEPTENGGFEIFESDKRCVTRTKRGTNPPLSYLYDIETDQVLHLPAFKPVNVVVTDRKKDKDGREGKAIGEFQFTLAETPESIATFQRLQKEFPNARRLGSTGGQVLLTTRDWEKSPAPGSALAPEKISTQKWDEKIGSFHFLIDDKDAAILLTIHKNKDPFPLRVQYKNPCDSAGLTTSQVAYDSSPLVHMMHYENEETFVYPEDAIKRLEQLFKDFNKISESDIASLEKMAKQILQIFAKTPTEKDIKMMKAFGYADSDKAIENAIVQIKKRHPKHMHFLINHYCQGYQSCLAGLLYDVHISRANTPKNFRLKDQLIDILDEKRWAELLDSEGYDGSKALAKLEEDKRHIYRKEQLDLLESIQKSQEIEKLRTLFTNKWDAATPDKPVIKRTDYFSVKNALPTNKRK